MTLGLMQPYFFPYLGYFDLIRRTDCWVVFDTVQYIRRGWMNRNRILHPTSGWQYLTVPVSKHCRDTMIQDIEVHDARDWRSRILGQIQHYGRCAPYYRRTRELVEACLATRETLLSRLNVAVLVTLCDYLGLSWNYRYLSQMESVPGGIARPSEWAIEVCQTLGASHYVNPPGGTRLYDRREFERFGITLSYNRVLDFDYECGPREFIENLSIVDVLMWNSVDKVRQFLDLVEPANGTTCSTCDDSWPPTLE